MQQTLIRRLVLQPEDIIIIGSDGRDDLMVQSETGIIINPDEDRFLRLAEESGGNLDGLVDGLRHAEEITDDLSLIRIRCAPA